MRLAVLAVDGVFDTGLAAVLDTFATANELAPLLPQPVPPFECRLVGVRSVVHTANGLRLPLHAAGALPAPDWIVVPAPATKMPAALQARLAQRDLRDATRRLRDWHAEGARLAAACIGGFLLAESGLLDGHEATTSWWLGPLFRQRYPAVRLDTARMLVPSGGFVTAGAALGHVDLALWLVRQSSPELAALVARYLLVDERASQAPYIVPDHLAAADPLVQRFERWARGRLHEGFSLDAAARALATSGRTLQRRCEAVLGKSPQSFFQDLRVERAVHLLRTTRRDVEAIAAEVGYADGTTLRTLLRRRLGRGVRQLRGPLR